MKVVFLRPRGQKRQSMATPTTLVGLVTYPQHPNFLRRNATWTGAKLLILDDIYEKAVPPCVEPTFKIETKPELQQWGYVFREPMRNATDFETLVESCIVAGLGDPGAKGRIRLARLPGSMPPGEKAPGQADLGRLEPVGKTRRGPVPEETWHQQGEEGR